MKTNKLEKLSDQILEAYVCQALSDELIKKIEFQSKKDAVLREKIKELIIKKQEWKEGVDLDRFIKNLNNVKNKIKLKQNIFNQVLNVFGINFVFQKNIFVLASIVFVLTGVIFVLKDDNKGYQNANKIELSYQNDNSLNNKRSNFAPTGVVESALLKEIKDTRSGIVLNKTPSVASELKKESSDELGVEVGEKRKALDQMSLIRSEIVSVRIDKESILGDDSETQDRNYSKQQRKSLFNVYISSEQDGILTLSFKTQSKIESKQCKIEEKRDEKVIVISIKGQKEMVCDIKVEEMDNLNQIINWNFKKLDSQD